MPHVGLVVALLLLAFFVLGFIFYAALFAAMGSTVTNEQDVQQACMPVMLLLIASIVFMQPILLDPDELVLEGDVAGSPSRRPSSCRCA